MNTINEDVVSQIKHDINIVIGRQIMLLRKSQGLTGQALAKKLGVSQQQVSRYELGVCKVDVNLLIAILIHLDYSLEAFFQKVFLATKERSSHMYKYCQSVFGLSEVNKSTSQYYLIERDMSDSVM